MLPLEKKTVDADDGVRKIPALDPSRVTNINFITYQPPPIDLSDHASQDEWMERTSFIEEDLMTLLKLPHDKFWCQVVFDESLHRSIDSYLRSAPRSFDSVYALPETLQAAQNKLHRAFFMVCLRMATYKESKADFITPEVFGEILYENYIYDVPKLLDLCVLYGADNDQLLNKMINNVFTQQPKYRDDLRSIVPAVIHVLESIAEKCGVSVGQSSSPQKLGQSGAPALSKMPISEFQDLVLYLHDTARTLDAFFSVYPEGTEAFIEDDFPIRWACVCESLISAITTAMTERQDLGTEAEDLSSIITRKFAATQAKLTDAFHKIIQHNCLQALMNPSHEQAGNEAVERYIHIMSSILNERRFLAVNEALHPFSEDRDILTQSQADLDETQMEFLQDGISQAFALYGKKKSTNLNTVKTTEVISSTEAKRLDVGNNADSPADTYKEEAMAACAPSIKGVELESLISSVQDLLPDLGEGFIELCLEEFDYSVEKVINAVLEDKLPPSLKDLDMTMARSHSPVLDEGSSLIDQRQNVFEGDEFDVFQRDTVDMSRIHQGKKEKNIDLDDKSMVSELRPLYSRYGTEFVESMYDQAVEYDDEYDDTYDSHVVGADDADDADELTAKRLLPRRVAELSKEGSESHTSTPSDESEDSDDGRRNFNAFVEDPAKVRERRAQRNATRAARAGQRPQAPKTAHDVKGQAKGQGQTKEVLHNRAWKEKNKATRVHHNRKALSDKKRRA